MSGYESLFVCLFVCLSQIFVPNFCPRFWNVEVSVKTTFWLIQDKVDVCPKNKQTNKHQTKLLQFKNKQFLFIYSYPLSNRGAVAKASGAEVPQKYDDV